jgi:glycerol-3-phosphate dehydrogenase (NAD(P)+)
MCSKKKIKLQAKNKMLPITVLGAGSWGSALAVHLARNHNQVILWDMDAANIALMQESRENKRYLPGVIFPESITCVANLSDAVQSAHDILLVIPSHAFAAVLEKIQPFLDPQARIVWATKGLVPVTAELLSVKAREILGPDIPLAVLSGPSFALEVGNDLPTAFALASDNPLFAQHLLQRFHRPTFRIYFSTDMIGVQLGGAIKNVLALAVGMSDGMGYGANARAALITRGLREMMRLGLALGAQAETLTGLSGLGDLVLTCTDNQSRNRRFGMALAKAQNPAEAEAQIGQVVEGKGNALQVHQLAQHHHIDMPICDIVYRILYENLSPEAGVQALLLRPAKAELES